MYFCYCSYSFISVCLSLCSVLLDTLIQTLDNQHASCVLLGICVLFLTDYPSLAILVNILIPDHWCADPVLVVFLVLHQKKLLLYVKLENFPTQRIVFLAFLDFIVLILAFLHIPVRLVSIPVFMD